jgi:hypothetical protein
MVMTPIALYPLLDTSDTLTQFRLVIENAPQAEIALHRIFTAADTRHQINNPVWLQGSTDYLNWTGDLNFLRSQIQRWRLAMRYAIDEFGIEKYKYANIPWPNHDGRPGIGYDENGKWYAKHGHGMGGSYFDLIPFGGKDGWTTLLVHDVLRRMADLEERIQLHPQWNIPGGPMRLEPAYLKKLAAEVKANFQKVFWNPKTGRFIPGIDRDDKFYDYGFLYFNLEALYYGLASDEQAESVYAWIDGKRIVEAIPPPAPIFTAGGLRRAPRPNATWKYTAMSGMPSTLSSAIRYRTAGRCWPGRITI